MPQRSIILAYDSEIAGQEKSCELLVGPPAASAEQVRKLVAEVKAAISTGGAIPDWVPGWAQRLEAIEWNSESVPRVLGLWKTSEAVAESAAATEQKGKKVKSKMFGLFGAALLACSMVSSVMAQGNPVYGSQVLGTVLIPAQGATNVAWMIDVRKQKDVAVQIEMQNSTSATDVISLAYQYSVDGINVGSTTNLLVLAPTGVTKRIVPTNILSGGVGFIFVPYLTNAAATAICTNRTLYGVKISAP